MQARIRIVGIDILRSLAIFGAMSSHAFTAADAFSGNMNGVMTAARLAMGAATPIFICLFGAMLEIIYRCRINYNGFDLVTHSLLSRAFQCYILYIVTVALRYLLGDFSLGYALRCALLIGVTPFSDILKFYAVVLALSPVLLRVSNTRNGFIALCISSVVVHLLHPLLSVISVPEADVFGGNYFNFAAGFVYGGGVGPGGPSVIHGLTMVIFGMGLGRLSLALLNERGDARRKARLGFGGTSVALGVVLLAVWPWGAQLHESVQSLIRMTYRNGNYPIYFALGAITATLLTWGFLEFYDVRRFTFGRRLAFLGSVSLFTFSFGNMVLVAAPSLSLDPPFALAYALCLLSAVLLLSWVFWASLHLGRARLASGGTDWLSSWARFQGGIIRYLHATTKGVAITYSRSIMRGTSWAGSY